jgi:hypothetical protein
MAPRCAVLLAALALAGGLSGCGADDELSSDIPRTSPDLTIPTATTELPPEDTATSTSTTSTSTLPQSATPPAVAQPPAAVVAPPPPAASTTGGAGAGPGTGGQSTTGGATPTDPDFQNFCRDNPGAGPPC